uniref:Reverse transcriptase domain-containing protein n=1 Tax=Pristionchus pacificus TaxID=54126 RepID=A0A8R1UTH5_PRIPA
MVDKASGNYAITCKKLYLQFMEKELNTQSNDGKTYEIKDQLDPVSIKLNHEKFTRSFGIAVQTEGNLPKIYGIPKMHKNPIKFRFITGAHDSTLKPLSIELQKILRFLHVVQQLNTVQNKRSEIFCADFSSLFTNLPHNVVKEKLYYLIDLMFKNAGSEYIMVQGTNVRYDRNNSSTSGRSYHKNDLKGIIEFILRNSFAYYGGNLYQQQKGIPQGNNASPQIADLTLAVMEYQYISNNIRSGHPLSFSLNRTFRYIDDLFHISDKKDEFVRITTDMYHHSLTLEQTNTDPKDILDMSIKVTITGTVQTSLYNKTDDYSFSVVRYPHYESNIPISMGLNTLHGEIIRIFRNCSLFEHFLERTRQLARYFLQIQYPKEILCSRLYSTLNKTPAISLKYAVYNNDICMHIIEKL